MFTVKTGMIGELNLSVETGPVRQNQFQTGGLFVRVVVITGMIGEVNLMRYWTTPHEVLDHTS